MASLGCPKNTVDANAMAVLLERAGLEATLDAGEADLIVVNTCAFIEDARQESLDSLQSLAASIQPDQRLVAAGCWAQRDPDYLQRAVPRINALLGTRSWGKIVSVAEGLLRSHGQPTSTLIENRLTMLPEEVSAPGYVVSGPSAFLKIADGCSRECAFCAIPAIKGPTVSRELEAVLSDARALQELGVLEVNLIAQDATFYGHDLGLRDGLAQLLERLTVEAPGIPWIRVLYAFPGFITERLITAIRDQPHILSYVDIPLQHAHPDLLRRMRRPADMDSVRRMLCRLREEIPGVALRTTMIVGFPGESEAEFSTLMDFIQEIRFDRLGVFPYSHEPETAAEALEDDVPEGVKQERYDAVMTAQQQISLESNQALVGERLEVLLEGKGDNLTVGRSYRDAPEIDGLVIIPEEVRLNRIVNVEVTEALPYDLIGNVVD